MSGAINGVVNAFGRAVLSQFHYRMLLLTLLPFVVTGLIWAGLFYLAWDLLIEAIRLFFENSTMGSWLYRGMDMVGLAAYKGMIGPLLLTIFSTPLIVVSALLVTGLISSPLALRHVARRRFPHLEKRQGGGFFTSLVWSTWSMFLFLILFIVTLPLWLIPPFFALIPPLLWGWLTYRVMAFDSLAEHASSEERHQLFAKHRAELLTMGIICGLLGSAPTLFWVISISFVVVMFPLFPIFAVATLWLYVLIFVFSALWFAHFCLAALDAIRAATPLNDLSHMSPPFDSSTARVAPVTQTQAGGVTTPLLPPELPRTPLQ